MEEKIYKVYYDHEKDKTYRRQITEFTSLDEAANFVSIVEEELKSDKKIEYWLITLEEVIFVPNERYGKFATLYKNEYKGNKK